MMGSRSPRTVTSRRKFIDWVLSRTLTVWLLSTSAGSLVLAVVYPAARFLVPPESGESPTASVTLPIELGSVARDTGTIFKFGSRPGILVRTSADELRAFSAVCTHLGCTVQYRPDFGHIWCACHNGHFDLNGKNIAGPPPSPLEQYMVNVRGEQIVVSKGS